MAKQIRIGQRATIGLKMTPEERELLLEEAVLCSDRLADVLRSTDAGVQEVRLTLGDLDQLAGCVAAESRRTRDPKLRKKLDRIATRAERLMGMFQLA